MKLKVGEGSEIPISVLRIDSRERYLWISLEKVPVEEFPPCIRNIIKSESKKGSNRAGAILASFLGQAGWREQDALELWRGFAERLGVKASIFKKWFGRMHCPSCRTIKSEAAGYPDLGLSGLKYCVPDDRCSSISWPLEYSLVTPCWGWLKPLGRKTIVHVYNWLSAREEALEVSEDARIELEKAVADAGSDRQIFVTKTRERGRLRIRFIVREQELRKSMLSDLL